jgi:hypothetical protein
MKMAQGFVLPGAKMNRAEWNETIEAIDNDARKKLRFDTILREIGTGDLSPQTGGVMLKRLFEDAREELDEEKNARGVA